MRIWSATIFVHQPVLVGDTGAVISWHHCRLCEPGQSAFDIACSVCGDGPILAGALAEQAKNGNLTEPCDDGLRQRNGQSHRISYVRATHMPRTDPGRPRWLRRYTLTKITNHSWSLDKTQRRAVVQSLASAWRVGWTEP
ncbi:MULTISPECIES: hypothetical protein [Rhodococcus]|uniref:Uncharacterized protein n=1 Tax=Rhodococcus oxybenzonivorans TaxID=1990687 RepID=A0AAE4UX38_9NOCA|nr:MULTISPECIES: hypothetical protein [Rhodococcus]MDV7243387.1 hypothetical protein [Rhodococcus oxybenzonivorans]MDV7263913.1 hypothetical protein [Rhodococcus oxybenzonivorans]MDV7276813.1 hypothetical protein [Rhodococcus oxybenzonivorans]MDV7334353.1 hypothetical protein [Rhodococcus oxybenzonivorans]MDV7344508.1 hypothetical protein [Rhodococcus oxybenzonivorans]